LRERKIEFVVARMLDSVAARHERRGSVP
jgi:hypothetical protein